MEQLDKIVVIAYLALVFIISIVLSLRAKKKGNDKEFLTGGNNLNWKQTGLTLIAMMFDPGIVGNTALAFTIGLYVVQWNAVNIWFTSWFAGMFFIGIYWRTKIVTTPEYLEKRFNPATRGVFSLIMVVMLVSFLSFGVYTGGLLLQESFGWNIQLSYIILLAIAAFYVIFGGVKTMLIMDTFQGALLLITMFAVGIVGLIQVGGLEGIKEIAVMGKHGTPLNSVIPPVDWSLFSDKFYPLITIPTFCVIAGLSWIICNFGMAQRLLASKNEQHAQKALIVAGVFNVFTLIFAYMAGVAMRKLMPEVEPDKSFIVLITTYFPTGVKGLLMVGLLAALLSTVDGLLSSSSTLLNHDIYNRFFAKNASDSHLKWITRIFQFVIIGFVIIIIPLAYLDDGSVSQGRSAYEILLEFLGSIMGVLISIYVLGMFFKRTTAKASFIAMIVGIVLGFYLLNYTDINFAHVGTIQFLVVIALGLGLSYFENPKTDLELENMTVWTVKGVKGPWIGLSSWPALWKWAVALPVFWFLLTIVWEMYLKM